MRCGSCSIRRERESCASAWLAAQHERQQLALTLKERDNELTAKDYKIQQARKMVEDERRGRLAAEQDRDAFAQQLDMLKDILLSPNSERPRLEESIESILDVSDLSFDDNTRDNLEVSRNRQKRRSSARHEAKKARKSRSLGNRLDSGSRFSPPQPVS
ncbi:hypothetical protein TCAL_16342 [Tigriopus californicus]|uniref:Uncharacterized protein n=1 Tax=Tigriopus californicus TaxID=6832 RepID=A0A553N6G8_TIGCA|nr:hypothetical protein TCAL_16342 [Tigriopus californicus]